MIFWIDSMRIQRLSKRYDHCGFSNLTRNGVRGDGSYTSARGCSIRIACNGMISLAATEFAADHRPQTSKGVVHVYDELSLRTQHDGKDKCGRH